MDPIGVFQPKLQLPAIKLRPALKNHRLRANVLDPFNPLRLLDMDPQDLPGIIRQLQPQRQYLPFRITNGYHIHSLMLHHSISPPFLHIIAHSFVLSKGNLYIASKMEICYNEKKLH